VLDRGDQTGDQPEGESRSFVDLYRGPRYVVRSRRRMPGDDGRCGYRARGESSYRHSAGHGQTFPVELGETLTTISVCCPVEVATDLDEMATMTRA
jgi:hypothetical protein